MKFKNINWHYALGEIVIVIIGISIAFSLNNWNEKRKNEYKKNKYLENLKSDIENEKKQLEKNIDSYKSYSANALKIIPHMGRELPGRDTIYPVLFQLFEIINFIPQKVTYNTMINSGDFNLIQNFELKTKIQKHFSDQDLIVQDYGREQKIHEKYLSDFLIYKMDYDKMQQGNHEYLDNKNLKNIIYSLYGTYKMEISSSERGIQSCNTLISEIEQELNR